MNFIKRYPHLLVLCLAVLYFFGRGAAPALQYSWDFIPVYSGARCLLQGCNPYDTSQLEKEFVASGGQRGEMLPWHDEMPVYPPSTFLMFSPLAALPFPAARLLLLLINGCLFAGAAAMILYMCPPQRLWLATVMISIIVASSRALLIFGQPAVVAVAFLIFGVYLLLRNRCLSLASLLLMMSLAVKPQMGGLIVLYFLAKRIHWRHVAIAMAGAFALLLFASLILKLNPRSSNWPSDLRTNLAVAMQAGGNSDPRPTNKSADDEIHLQALTSVFLEDPGQFNPAARAISLGLLVALAVAILGSENALEMHFLMIGALTSVSLLLVYHRFYDSRLLLLGVPAALIVLSKRRLLGSVICVLTVLPNSSVQGRVRIIVFDHIARQSLLQHKFLFAMLLRQQNLELLILCCLYLAAIFSIRLPAAPAIPSDTARSRTLPSLATQLKCLSADSKRRADA